MLLRRSERPGNSIAAVAGVVLLLVVGAARAQDGAKKYHAPAVVPLTGPLNVATARSFERRIERALAAKCDLLMVELDVNAGSPYAARIASEAVRRCGVRRVAFVSRRALGPGAAVALGCDELYVRPDAVIGDLSSVAAGEERVEWIKRLETWARERQRPVELVGKLAGDGGAGAVLNGREAAAQHLADGTAAEAGEILARAGATQAPTIFVESWVDEIVAVLNHPVATTALVVLGLIFLYIEVAAGGIGLAALPGGLCFLLFFWSKFLGGTGGWLEVVLFLAGLICLLLEIFLIPGFGVVGAAGILLVLVSLIMATQGFLLPRTPTDTRTLIQTLIQWSAGTILFAAAAVAITRRIGGLPVVKTLVLEPGEIAGPGEIFGAMPTAMTGVAATDLRPVGKARFGDRLYDVVTDGFFIPAGATVRIVEASPHRVQVTRV